MSLQYQHPIPSGKKRLADDLASESRKRAKAERECFRRGKHDAFKKLNDLFLKSLVSGRERRIYAIVMNKSKDSRGTARYSTYNSHPHEHWIPLPEEVVRATLAKTSTVGARKFQRNEGGTKKTW
ncbi:hypothetical protein DTO063F5_3812 [Paecilomyces variotii]|nr:hypothetical protein DTO063F5_3812 [Paecilomyces variotii]